MAYVFPKQYILIYFQISTICFMSGTFRRRLLNSEGIYLDTTTRPGYAMTGVSILSNRFGCSFDTLALLMHGRETRGQIALFPLDTAVVLSQAWSDAASAIFRAKPDGVRTKRELPVHAFY